MEKYLYQQSKIDYVKSTVNILLRNWGVESVNIEEFNKLSIQDQVKEINKINGQLEARERKIEKLTKRLGI